MTPAAPSPNLEPGKPPAGSPAPLERPSAAPRLFSKLRVRLLVLVVLAVLPALGLVIYSGIVQRQNARREASANAQRVARFAAAAQHQHVESSRQLLVTLAQLKEVHPARAEECTALFTALLRVHPIYANIGAFDTNGYLFASALPAGRVYGGDRSYFRIARDSGRFAVGEFQRGRVTEKYTLNLAYPIKDPTNTAIIGVVFVALDLNWLNQLAVRADLPEGATLTVVDRRGTIILRHQQPDPGKTWLGHSLTNQARFMRLLQSSGEITAEWPGLDGVRRLYASTPLNRSGGLPDAHVFVGIPTTAAYAAAHRTLIQNLIFLGIVATLALGAAWIGGDLFVLRHVRALVTAVRKMRAGDLTARSGVEAGPAEIGQLARSFDEMAATIEQQVGELKLTQSELKALNEELEQRVLERTLELKRSNEDLEQFAYVASHDLQEPLRMVNNYVGLLRQRFGGQLGPDAQEFIAFALDGAVRMQQLINDLLAYSRVGRQGRQFSPVSCEKALEGALANLKMAIADAGAEITHDPLPTVLGDLTLLTQLFQNLIGNALKFRGQAPVKVHVEAVRHGPDWHLTVRDNGIGIAPQDFERIFVIFQRLHGRDKYPGTGIGLSMCKKIVERHGGRIWLESKLGKGTAFFFTLPALAG